ncbi:MAG: sugar ABC transporter permease [Lachnospiraceae bacterium]|nr:sugar ABC transporter permease [Lachnospiraceae bacterium]
MKRVKNFFRYDNAGLFFILPAFLYMMFFVGYPIISNIILSFQNVSVRNLVNGQKKFIGFANYSEIFQDTVFRKAMGNTLLFTIACLLFQFLIGFLLALLFNKNFTFAKTIRGLTMIPWMMPMTVTALMFKFMFSTDVGIINYILKSSHLISENIEWLTTPQTAMIAVVAANVWIGIPFNTILISTGLTTIPQELYESAAVDGANAWQRLVKITLPLLRPTIESVLVLGFIYTFKVYDLVYVMTEGGPVNSTHLLSTYSYKLSFDMFQYSKGASVANVLFLILLLVGMLYLKITMRGEED